VLPEFASRADAVDAGDLGHADHPHTAGSPLGTALAPRDHLNAHAADRSHPPFASPSPSVLAVEVGWRTVVPMRVYRCIVCRKCGSTYWCDEITAL
jgi:hypothetical protein